MHAMVRILRQSTAFGLFPCKDRSGGSLPLAHRLLGGTRELIASGSQVLGQRKAGVSDNVISSRREVADAPPEGAKPQVHNARCAYKPLGQSVGTDSKIDSLAQNVLTLAPALRAGETAGDKPSVQSTGPGSCQAVEPNPSPDKGSRQLPTSYTSTK